MQPESNTIIMGSSIGELEPLPAPAQVQAPVQEQKTDTDEALAFIARRLQRAPGRYELRYCKATHNGQTQWISNTFGDTAEALQLLKKLHHYKGVYIGLNPVKPAYEQEQGKAVRDDDIDHITTLLIDIDPDRERDLSASDEERDKAFEVAARVKRWLLDHGLGFELIDSGNGYGFDVYADLPVEEAPNVKRLLHLLAERFNSSGAHIDIACHNPGRIRRLPGTWNRKQEAENRPQRMARVVETNAGDAVTDTVLARILEELEADLQPNTESEHNDRISRNGHKKNGTGRKPKNITAENYEDEDTDAGLEVALEALKPHAVAAWKPGYRHNLALYLSGCLRKAGVKLERALRWIEEVATSAGDEEIGERLGACTDTYSKAPGQIAGVSALAEINPQLASEVRRLLPTPGPLPARHNSAQLKPVAPVDIDLAQMLGGVFKDQLMFVENRCWYYWTGSHWQADRETLRVPRTVGETLVDMYAVAAANAFGDDQLVALYRKWRQQVGNWDKIMTVTKALRSYLYEQAENLDANEWMLNTPTGLLDLKTCNLTPHHPLQRCSKITRACYRQDKPWWELAPAWAKFLERILPDEEVRRFMQRSAGYALTGDTGEQYLWILYGSGANGKSTFIRAMLAAMRDYAIQAAATLLIDRDNKHPTEVADLEAVRLAVATETKHGDRLDEVLVKQLTGGDLIRARRMRQDFFQFEPTHKVWLVTNHKPVIRGVDTGIWRRVLLIPFEVEIPEEERDPHLLAKLMDELDGILTWAVDGLREYLQIGLKPPTAVIAATEEYRMEMDSVSAWLSERCVEDPTAKTTFDDLFEDYQQYCQKNGKHEVSQKTLGQVLKNRYEPGRNSAGARIYIGIRLATQSELQQRAQERDGDLPWNDFKRHGAPSERRVPATGRSAVDDDLDSYDPFGED